MLNIHVVPHTHDDVGWLKTVDQYYYGTRIKIQKANVQLIIDSVIEELQTDESKRFIYVETAYLWKWWSEQNENTRNIVKKLINNGQLEIIGGAWSMNDEAASHYHTIIDQFTFGHRWLNETLGSCSLPKIGWQIDPFGHGREMASLFGQMGFDGLFLGRIDYQDKNHREKSKTMEMVWEGSESLAEKNSDIFTGVLFNTYSPPSGFCFDILCDDEPIVDDISSPEYNVKERVAEFIRYGKIQSKSYRTNNVIFTMGNDFNYQDAHSWYKSLDRIIKYIQKHKQETKVNAFYSTPSCYLKSLHDANLEWPTKTDDFFPYASDPHAFWSGYFTSRPAIKYYERLGNNFLQVCKQLATFTGQPDEDINLLQGLNKLREVMGIMQHHDAVTGTEQQHVANDYARRISDAMHACWDITTKGLNDLLTNSKEDSPKRLKFESCPLLNISQCEVSENYDNYVLTIYNPSSQPASQFVRLPIFTDKYIVRDSSNKLYSTQIVPLPDLVSKIPGRFSMATNELVFYVEDIPPLGYKSLYISKTNISSSFVSDEKEQVSAINNKNYKLKLDDKNQISALETPFGDIPLNVDLGYYTSAYGNNQIFTSRASGAYIFRPSNKGIEFNVKSSKVYEGPLVKEIHINYETWASQIIRVYESVNFVEFNWLIGPIPIDDGVGKEVIIKYKTKLNSNEVFYTDSNGREMLKRKKNHRDSWNLTLAEPISGNYFPVTTRVSIEDKDANLRIGIVTDRSEGASSLQNGEVEVMLHRRMLHDDAFGVSEPLNETAYGGVGLVVRGKHLIVPGHAIGSKNSPSGAYYERILAQQTILSPWLFFADAKDISFEEFQTNYQTEYHGLNDCQNSQENFQVLTLEPWKNNSVLIRLEHLVEKNEGSPLADQTCINIQKLFSNLKIKSLRETTLSANQWLEVNHRLEFKKSKTFKDENEVMSSLDNNYYSIKHNTIKPEQEKSVCPKYKCDGENKNFEVTLDPMQIRTFVADL